MARKELKPELQGMRKAISTHRSEIVALKREVKSLTSQLKTAQSQFNAVRTGLPIDQASSTEGTARQAFVFAPEMLASMRSALGATQLQMAALLAVSQLSYSRWEKGQVTPRIKQLAKIEALVKMGPLKAEMKMRQAAKS